MRTIIAVLCSLASCASAKDLPLTPAWSGVWGALAGTDRCTVVVTTPGAADIAGAGTILLDCALGASAVRYHGPLVENGWHMPLTIGGTWGTTEPPTNWGFALVFPVCHPEIGPALFLTFTRAAAPLTISTTMVPQVVPHAAALCAGGGR